MVRLSSTLELLVEAGNDAAEQYELLRWVRCLSRHGLAERSAVLALLDDVARRCAALEASQQAPTGGPTASQAQTSELRAAGYLDQAACEAFDGWPGEHEKVARIVAEARAAFNPQAAPGPLPASTTPAPGVICRTCGERLPAIARFCGFCGIRVT